MAKQIMIAGTGSGCGKTTLTCAVLAALTSLGKDVISFKCGPDYIDPMFHKKATGVESRNLDIFLMGEEGVKNALTSHSANKDIAVLEGVMGIYDGLGNSSYASSNHVSLLTDTPTILVVKPKGLALSVCALIKGYSEFNKNNIRAIILNDISKAMFPYYKQMIEENLDISVIGFMPHSPEAQIESRHLGLVSADEIADIKDKISKLKDQALESIDMEALLKIAQEPSAIQSLSPPAAAKKTTVKLYIAKDSAFCFCYEDNHDLLRALGAEIKFFSPIKDDALPEDAEGLLLCGGYPELHGAALESNKKMRQSLKSAIKKGLPVYAEGGGFIYLQQSLTDFKKTPYAMLGVLPGNVKMTSRLQNFGYYDIEASRDNILCRAGDKKRVHFYRRSISDNEGDCFTATKPISNKTFPCIVAEGNIFAGYQHLYFSTYCAKNFLDACISHKTRRKA